MKLWIFSDIHLEFGEAFLPKIPDADVCVVAGDLLDRGPENSIAWLADNVALHMPVVFVAGNHEFYGGKFGFDLAIDRAREAAAGLLGMHFLENDDAFLGDVRFVGCTLWTDFELDGSDTKEVAWAMHNVSGLLADYTAVQDFSDATGKLTTQRTKTMHEKSRTFLRETLAMPFDGPTVVVTHHAPHRGSLHPRYANSPLNPGFVSDLEGLILSGKPDLWIHGHVHDCHDYLVGRTRVICNPKGYGNENPAFDPGLVVDV
jgi:3',5'-cyclic AMP phosphodiesterase CpdA